jgi:hypothetical protein
MISIGASAEADLTVHPSNTAEALALSAEVDG